MRGFFFQAEDGIRELVRSRGLGDVYKRQDLSNSASDEHAILYVAQGLTFHRPQPDHDEELELKKLPFEELYGMVVRGEVLDLSLIHI